MRVDFEALLPFGVIALLVWPLGFATSITAVCFLSVVIIGAGQFMVISRAASRPEGRLGYLLVNEGALASMVLAILMLQYVFSVG